MVEMGLSPINSQLANMEYMLYGGSLGLNPNVPSIYNGYRAGGQFNNPSFMGGYGYNPVMNGYYNPSAATSVFANPQAAAATAAGIGAAAGTAAGAAAVALPDKDLNVLADYASKVNDEGETFLGACTGGLTFAAFENMQNVKHPINAFRAMGKANKIFNLKNANIKAFWNSNPELAQNAYSQVQAAYRRMEHKFPVIQQWFAKPLSKADKTVVENLIKTLETEMAKAKPDPKIIAECTEKLKAARGMDGYIPSAWNKVKQFFGADPNKAKNFTAAERIANKSEQIKQGIAKATDVAKGAGKWFTKAKFLKEFKGWAIFELAIEGVTKVLPTYMEGGAESGNKQLVQSGAKAVASAAGWAAGRLAGGWLGTKVGAAIGSAVCPGLGTAIGAVIGFAGGCVGSWLAGKGIKALMGKEEHEKLAENRMKKTQEGQAELIQLAYQKAQAGEAPQEVVNSLNNVIRQVA